MSKSSCLEVEVSDGKNSHGSLHRSQHCHLSHLCHQRVRSLAPLVQLIALCSHVQSVHSFHIYDKCHLCLFHHLCSFHLCQILLYQSQSLQLYCTSHARIVSPRRRTFYSANAKKYLNQNPKNTKKTRNMKTAITDGFSKLTCMKLLETLTAMVVKKCAPFSLRVFRIGQGKVRFLS